MKAVVHLDGIDCGGIYLADSSGDNYNLFSNNGISTQFLKKFSSEKGPKSILEPIYLDSSQIQEVKNKDDEFKDIVAVAIVPVLLNNTPKAILSLGSHSRGNIPIRHKHTLEAIAIQIGAYLTRIDT